MYQRHKFSKKYSSRGLSGNSVQSMQRFSLLVGIAVISLAAFFPYLISISGGFIWDDHELLTENNLISASDGLYRLWCTTESPDYWPTTYTTFWIEWRLWGMNSTGYHATNTILHIIEALLIWIVLRKLSIPGAFFAAVIFAVHPVNVESVAWIAQRKNLMAMFFFLLSIVWYLKHLCSRHTPCAVPAHGVCGVQTSNVPAHGVCGVQKDRWYWLSLTAFVLAMLGKGSVAVLPVLLLWIVWWLRGKEKKWTGPFSDRGPVPFFSELVRTAPFFMVAAVLTVVNVWFQTHGSGQAIRTAGFVDRLLGAGGVVWFYLYKSLLPLNLMFVYPQWRIEAGNPLWWLPLIATLAVTAVLWRYRNTWSRSFLFAWGFFCVALIPVLGFMDVYFMKFSLVADHYQHIALLGVIALVAAGFDAWHRRVLGKKQWLTTVVAITAAGTLAFLSCRQNELYKDESTLYRATLEKNPSCWLAYNNLGNILFNEGRLKESIQCYKQTLLINPNHSEAHYNLANALDQLGQLPEAIEHYQQALRLNPKYLDAYNNLGNTLNKLGRPTEAIECYQQALRLKPDIPEAHYNMGNALVQTGRTEEAIEHLLQTLRLKPDFPEARNKLANAMFNTGRSQEAIEYLLRALGQKLDSPEAHYNLGNALFQTARLQEAIEYYKQAIQIKPDYIDAHNNLGAALIQEGRFDQAIEHFNQVLRLRPDYINAYSNMALAYAGMHRSSQAIAAGQKAVDLAREQGQLAQAKEIEIWLNSYRASLSKPPNQQPPSDPAPPSP